MRIGSLAAARPTYYDRNGVSLAYEYTSYGIAPHAETQRWTYTVPAGKKAYVETFRAFVYRITAATSPNRYAAAIFVNPSGGGSYKIIEATSYSNVADTSQVLNVGGSILLFAGDQIAGYTLDASTGGTLIVSVSIKVSQFDA